jgi:DNA-binding transcriptional regulator LsrR (DeoR family)
MEIQSWEVEGTKSKVEDKLIGQIFFYFFVSKGKMHRIELSNRQIFLKKN